MSALLDALGTIINVQSRDAAAHTNTCAKCGQLATEWRDEISRAEYKITLWCQRCQDEYFGIK